jgi:tryptophan synthase alpha chain
MNANAIPTNTKTQIRGRDRIASAFESVHSQGRAALMPYFTLGFPDPSTSLEIISAISQAGSDLIELGVPFSDPLADGPTIQRSTQQALEAGMNVARCLELVAGLRTRGVRQPLILMGYFNPILAYGLERFVAEAAEAGADGFIIPDLPPEEAGEMEAACQDHKLALIYLVAPTSTPERLALAAQRTSGFLYLISLTGVTGARANLPPHLKAFVDQVRAQAQPDTPLALGFGISTAQQAGAVGELVDGVIVGSALIEAVSGTPDPAAAAGQFIRELRAGL